MAIRVGIKGLGRIGRLVYRAMREKYPGRTRVVAVNDGGDAASRDTIDAAVQEYAEGLMKGMSAYSDEPLVSSDLRGDPHSSIFSALDTLVIGGDRRWSF
jgi:glyceraldehyde-3-phosphate dehydrogenase/erythrose-4-phosphate dehydrogenase